VGRKHHQRNRTINARLSTDEFEEWQRKAAAAGVSLSELLRQAMSRTRPWTAAACDVERERNRQIARIGRNLNQIARWANRYKGRAEAVEVIAHLAAIERDLADLRGQAEGREQC
jgi:uncharacterized protein YukE